MTNALALMVTAVLAVSGLATADDPANELLAKVDEASDNPMAFANDTSHDLSGTYHWAHGWACDAGHHYLGDTGGRVWGIEGLCYEEPAPSPPHNQTDANDTEGYRPPMRDAANETTDDVEETYHAVDEAVEDPQNETDHGFDALRVMMDAGGSAIVVALDAGGGIMDAAAEAGVAMASTVEQLGDEISCAVGHFSGAFAGAADWSSEFAAGTISNSAEETHDAYDVLAEQAAHTADHVADQIDEAIDSVEIAIRALIGGQAETDAADDGGIDVDVGVSVRSKGLLDPVTSRIALP
ncbi:MAG: hypothetical protein HY556_03165 [Euryarchaeota archaeon]|nr:hypothetical protein [Euryarchaeota archaeon]